MVVPSSEELSNADLAQDKGSGPELLYPIGEAIAGGIIEGADYYYNQRAQHKKVNPATLAAKVALGTAFGAIDGTVEVAEKTIEYGCKAAKYAYKALKWTFKAADKAIDHLWKKAAE